MQRVKIIGAIVLLVGIGLIVADRLGGPDDSIPGGGESAVTGSESGPVGGGGSPAGAASAVLPASGQTWVYAIDPAQSEIYWRIYRSGALARLGHNHVISLGEFEGSVTVASDLQSSSWALSFPVAGLVIDDPDLRARYGEDFESIPSEEDKSGTKTNMLSEGQLNGAAFPEIQLEGTGVGGTLDAAQLPVTIHILGRSIEQTFPASIAVDSESVTVTGEYRLNHEDLGMTPFSLFGGAMAVGDEIDFSYRLHAVAAGQ